MPTTYPKRKIFISRSCDGDDSDERTKRLAAFLEGAGHEVFADPNHEVEQGWPADTNRKIQECDHIIVVFSKHYAEKVARAPKGGEPKQPDVGGDGVVWEWNLIQNRLSRAQSNHFATACVFADEDKLHILSPLDATDRLSLPETFPLAESEDLDPSLKEFLDRVATRVAAKQVPPDQRTQFKEEDLGIILIGDMVDFSADEERVLDRRKALHEMWQFLLSDKDLKQWETLLDSTLDGAVVIIKGKRHDAALEFAAKWINFVENRLSRPGFGFRVGVHFGYFDKLSRVGDPEKGQGKSKQKTELDRRMWMIFGTAPNDADRLTRIGDSGSIIVSESFVKNYEFSHRRKLTEVFPPVDDDPFQAFPKPTQPQEFRVYTGHTPKGEKLTLPVALQEIQQANTRIFGLLKEIANEFWFSLEELTEALQERKLLQGVALKSAKASISEAGQKKAKLRVSLFGPNPECPNEELACTEFREVEFIGGKKAEELTKSGTTYSLVSPPDGQGPPGRAFKSGKIIVVNRLKTGGGYVPDLLGRGFGLTEELIQHFGRRARASICIPCQMSNEDFHVQNFEYLICLDLLNPLDSFEPEWLHSMARDLQELFQELVVLLMRVRR